METVNSKLIIDEVMPPKSGKAVELKKLRVEGFEAA